MLTIRQGLRGDAPSLARMINNFNVEEGSPGRVDEAGVTDLCLAANTTYQAIVAEEDHILVGYALLMRYFDTDSCAWCIYMQDLFVVPDRRSQGIGRRLIASAAKITIDRNHPELFWHVRNHNQRGRRFYAAIGGEEQTPVPVTLKGDALIALAREA